MNHETLEQAAIRYASEKIETRYPIDAREDFKAGASWREQQAASGFERWLHTKGDGRQYAEGFYKN